jgi:hypothetical protein
MTVDNYLEATALSKKLEASLPRVSASQTLLTEELQ